MVLKHHPGGVRREDVSLRVCPPQGIVGSCVSGSVLLQMHTLSVPRESARAKPAKVGLGGPELSCSPPVRSYQCCELTEALQGHPLQKLFL